MHGVDQSGAASPAFPPWVLPWPCASLWKVTRTDFVVSGVSSPGTKVSDIELLKQDHRTLCCCHKSWRGWPRDAFWRRPWYHGPWGLRQMIPRVWCWDPSQWDANCGRGSLLHVRCQVQRALHMWRVVAQLGTGGRGGGRARWGARHRE